MQRSTTSSRIAAINVETPDTNDDGTTPSSEQQKSATVGPKDVETTDRGSVISSRTDFTLNRSLNLPKIRNYASKFSFHVDKCYILVDVDSAISIDRVNMWLEMPVLFITSRDPGEGRKFEKLPPFPLRFFWCQSWPPSYKIKGDKFILSAPLPLRSMEIENFKRRYLRYLKR